MNLKELLITEEKMNNYIQELNKVKGDPEALKQILADRQTYSEYLKYIGIPEALATNPAVIELSLSEFEAGLRNGLEVTKDGIDAEHFVFGVTEQGFSIGKNDYFKTLEDSKIKKYNVSSILSEETIFNKYGLALEYHNYGMDHDYTQYKRGKGQFSYDSYDGIATDSNGTHTDSGNPFRFFTKSENHTPNKYYELYRQYPYLNQWFRRTFPDYVEQFDMIDTKSTQSPTQFTYTSELENKSDEELQAIATEMVQANNSANEKQNNHNNETGKKIVELGNYANNLTSKLNISFFNKPDCNREIDINGNTRNSLNDFTDSSSDEELANTFEHLSSERHDIVSRTRQQSQTIRKMNDIISQLVDIDTRKRKQAQAEEAKRMKNPIYRLKKKFGKSHTTPDDDDLSL